MKNNMKKTISLLVIGAFLIFCEWFFFRNVIGSSLLIGDRGDGRLTTLLTEHWWNFFNGRESFGELAMLYPLKNAIGYSDMFLGFGIIHSALRFLGVNMFYAYKYTLIIVHCAGMFATLYLCRKKLQMSLGWSLFATVAFAFSATLAKHAFHTQLFAVAFLPFISIGIIDFWRSYTSNKKYSKTAFITIFLFVLIMYNSWYIAYFTMLFAGVWSITYALLLWQHKILWQNLWHHTLVLKWKILSYALFAVILLIPFIYTYIPILQQSGGFSYHNAITALPEFADLINVGDDNPLMGKFIQAIQLNNRGYSCEVVEGFSLILLILFGTMWYISGKQRNIKLPQSDISMTEKCQILLVQSLFISIVVCFLLIVRLSANGVSLWYILYHILPGASSLRAIARFMLYLIFPMAIITAYTADKYISLSKKRNVVLWGGLLVLLFVSNSTANGVSASWRKTDEVKWLESVATPPQDVESFFIINVSYNLPHFDVESLDAYEIANFFNLHTINGYTGKYPEHWHLGDKNHYNQAVKEWVNHNKLENVYAYDKGNNVWIPYEEYIADIQQYQPGVTISFTQDGNANKYTESGFSHPEPQHTWTEGRNAQLNLFIKDKPTTNLRLKITAWPFLGGNITSQTVKVYANDTLIETWQIKQEGEYAAIIPASVLTSENIALRFDVSNPMSPKNLGMSEDSRLLGIAFKTLTLSQEEVK